MNLADLLRRRDRSVMLLSGKVEPGEWKAPGGTERVVRFDDAAVLRLTDAHEFALLKGFPAGLDWTLVGTDTGIGRLAVDIISIADPARRARLAVAEVGGAGQRSALRLRWPLWAGDRGGFHLELRQEGQGRAMLSLGLLLNPRQRVLPWMQGTGVEVGPGLNPHVLPSAGVEVRYVEALSAEQWLRLYKKTDQPPRAVTDNLWANYVVGSASTLDICEDGSLDFIFSNHVFEHLVNPLGVLEHWLRKLKPGGVIGGVVPDLRHTFDLRQPGSTLAEILAEHAQGGFDLRPGHYQRWCRYTAPYNTPEELVARNYSVHAHYYTPQSFDALVGLLRDEGRLHSAFYDTAANNKDFGFLLWKATPDWSRLEDRPGADTQ
ncbi:MAG TPA: methyltransferase domain-containing protein [Solimonas sp.]|nr:methyltransferase domain-containing protein [Solimonas sp.]